MGIKGTANRLNAAGRADAIRRGRFLEYLTIVWNLLEGIISVGAGLLAGSVALVGFGLFLYRKLVRWRTALASAPGCPRTP